MPCSHIERLWKGIKSLGSLKRFDLSKSKRLFETPDLTRVPYLESLHLEDCTSLYEIHPSIFQHKRLKLLNLRACTSLQSLPDKIDLQSLERLYLSNCSRLEKLPDTVGNMTSLRLLYLNGTFIKELPYSIGRLSRLSVLSLQDCRMLSTLPSVFGHLLGLSLKVVELPCARLEDMESGEGKYLWKPFLRRTTVKFSNSISMPLLHNFPSSESSEFFQRRKIVAFYIGFDGRHFGILNEGVVAYDLLSRSDHKVIYGSSMVHRIPDGFNNRSCSSSLTLEMPPDLDTRRKVMGYALFVAYDTILSSHCSCFDFYFKTDEGPLSTRPLRLSVLTLRVRMGSYLSSIWVYIPANWFLIRVKNVDGWSYLKVSVRVINIGGKAEVKECGVRVVHQHDAQEFYDSITSMYPLGSFDSEVLHHLYSYSKMGCVGV